MTGSSTHSIADRLFACFAVGLLVSTAAHGAQSVDEKERSARARFVQATKDYNLGNFDKALDEYKAVYELKPHPALLFNIAQCYRQLGDYSAAAFYYRRYRDEAKAAGPDAQVVNGLIAEVEAKERKRDAHQREIEITREAAKLAADKEALQAATQKLEVEARFKPSALGPPSRETRDTIFTKWWFWAAAGVVVTSASLYYGLPLHPRKTSLGEIGVRAAR